MWSLGGHGVGNYHQPDVRLLKLEQLQEMVLLSLEERARTRQSLFFGNVVFEGEVGFQGESK